MRYSFISEKFKEMHQQFVEESQIQFSKVSVALIFIKDISRIRIINFLIQSV